MIIRQRRSRIKSFLLAAVMLFNVCSLHMSAKAEESVEVEEVVVKEETVVVPEEIDPPVAEMEVVEEEVVIEPIVEQPEEPSVEYYDVPLSEDLQDHIFELCENYDIDPALIICMIQRESNFRPEAMGDSGESYGLMQIKKKYQRERMAKLGCTNLRDPYENLTVGIDLFSELLESGDSVEWALMAYNGGPSYANRMISRGRISNYAKSVVSTSKTLNTITVESV